MKHSTWTTGALRRTRLAASLAAAIGTAGLAFIAEASPLHVPATAHAPATPRHPATTYEVTSCADDGSPGTLRYVIDHAGEGDAADLDSLACSTITLGGGEIVIPQNLFYIVSSNVPVTIDAGGTSRVFEHDGDGALYLRNIEAANGYFKYNSAGGIAKGGCILSNGPVVLVASGVTGCTVANTLGQVRGGGIYALGSVNAYQVSHITGNRAAGISAFGGGLYSTASIYLEQTTISDNVANAITGVSGAIIEGGGIFTSGGTRLSASTVSGNQATATDGIANGGGILANGGVYLRFSTVTGNSASAPNSSGGGLLAQGASYVYYSTIDHNQSVNNGAMAFIGTVGSVKIGNSTISTNTATTGSSALFASLPTAINNSTIAFNVAAGNDAGLYFYPGGSLDLESTIVSNNASTSGTSVDFVSRDSVAGSHNLIANPGSAVPGDTLTGVDPHLLPLAGNFTLVGPLTHALAPDSVAIDHGSNPRDFQYDERGFFHVRAFGLSADIGAYEWDGTSDDTIFADGFD